MAIQASLQALIGGVLSGAGVLGDVLRPIYLHAGTQGAFATYDPATQTTTRAETSPSVPVEALRLEYKQMRIDNVNVFPRDMIYQISTQSLAAAGLGAPQTGWRLQDAQDVPNTYWEIISVNTDPASTMYLLHARPVAT